MAAPSRRISDPDAGRAALTVAETPRSSRTITHAPQQLRTPPHNGQRALPRTGQHASSRKSRPEASVLPSTRPLPPCPAPGPGWPFPQPLRGPTPPSPVPQGLTRPTGHRLLLRLLSVLGSRARVPEQHMDGPTKATARNRRRPRPNHSSWADPVQTAEEAAVGALLPHPRAPAPLRCFHLAPCSLPDRQQPRTPTVRARTRPGTKNIPGPRGFPRCSADTYLQPPPVTLPDARTRSPHRSPRAPVHRTQRGNSATRQRPTPKRPSHLVSTLSPCR